MIKHNAKLIGLALITVLGTACATNLTIDTSADAEVSYDGLYPVEGTRVSKAWARRDVDLSGYNKIMLEGVGIQYRPVKKRAGTRSGGGTEFPILPERKEELREVLREGFVAELAKTDRFEIVSEPGPDVLLIRGALIDVVSHVPPERAGRSDVYLSSVGQATLVLEVIDSQSESVLIRSVDRRAAETMGGIRSNSATNRSEVRRLAGRWGSSLREGLEFLANDFSFGKTD